jgi:phosphoglycerate dehydrogenase-like enzyme
VSSDTTNPDAIILRSYDMHNMEIPESVVAVARAGAGVNNIPIAKLSARGVPVFNSPGANANAVKELAIAGLLVATRKHGPLKMRRDLFHWGPDHKLFLFLPFGSRLAFSVFDERRCRRVLGL